MKAAVQSFIFKRIPLLVFLCLYILLTLSTYKSFSLTMDEFFVYTRGEYFYHKVVGNDRLLQKGFVIKERGNENLLYYNSSYPAVLYALNDSGSYEVYHLINMIVGMGAFISIYEMLLFATKRPFYAIFGPIFLFFTPRFLGAIPANPKDIPFAVFYTISLFFILIQNKLNVRLKLIILGLLIGFTAAVRLVGFVLLPISFLFVAAQFGKNLFKKWRTILPNMILDHTVMFIIAYFMFMVSMPYVAADPLNHMIELLKVNQLYPWSGTVFFLGEEFTEQNIPVYYLPMWLLITIPLFLLGNIIPSFTNLKSEKLSRLRNLMVISIELQLLLYFIMKPVIYNGMRHYLFFLPQIVILSVIGLYQLRKWKFRRYVYGLVGLNIAWILVFYMQFHPYQYSYFNVLSGTIHTMKDHFETDYWGASDREALLWLKEYTDQKGIQNPRIFLCSKSMSRAEYFPDSIDQNADPSKADFIVCFDERQMKKLQAELPGTILHTVKRQGITFGTVYELK